MSFAETEHLVLRAYNELDKHKLLELENDQRVLRPLRVNYVLPAGPAHWSAIEKLFQEALMAVIVEVKKEHVGLRRRDGEQGEVLAGVSESTDTDTDLFVGYALLHVPAPRNRDTTLTVSLSPRWWNLGLGTELLRWLVGYAFEQLNMHRVTLGLFADNPRALKCYTKVGFIQEGLKRKALFQDGKWVDEIWMGIVDEEWFDAQKK